MKTDIYIYIFIYLFIYLFICLFKPDMILCVYMIISGVILLRMRNISNKVLDNIKIDILCSKIFFPKNRTVYGIMWENMVKPDRPQTTI